MRLMMPKTNFAAAAASKVAPPPLLRFSCAVGPLPSRQEFFYQGKERGTIKNHDSQIRGHFGCNLECSQGSDFGLLFNHQEAYHVSNSGNFNNLHLLTMGNLNFPHLCGNFQCILVHLKIVLICRVMVPSADKSWAVASHVKIKKRFCGYITSYGPR